NKTKTEAYPDLEGDENASAAAGNGAGDATSSEKVAQCMRMLEGKTDEHKFAGLLMVTKLNDLPAEQLQQVRRQVLTTVGVSFFVRLLHTKGSMTHDPTVVPFGLLDLCRLTSLRCGLVHLPFRSGADEGEALSSFQKLGLNLIARYGIPYIFVTNFSPPCTVGALELTLWTLRLHFHFSFCADPVVAEEFAGHKLVHFLLEQLASRSTPLETCSDCVRILTGLIASAKGQEVRLGAPSVDIQRWVVVS
ncbi:hypothetical protein BBJ28_00021558, partial [Nothophytophthora sp. Chile5]